MKEIKLTQGMVALVDDADFEELSRFRWALARRSHTCYAIRHVRREDGIRTTEAMHRYVMCPNAGMVIDHINHNGLDNRRENLRIVSSRENSQNLRPKPGRSSKYMGVSWHKASLRWLAQARMNGENRCIGIFDSEIEAAAAYQTFVASIGGGR